MRTRTWTMGMLMVAAVAVTGLYVAAGGRSRPGGADGVAAPGEAFRWRLPAGTELAYELAWSSTQRMSGLGATPVDGALAVGGRLVLRSHGRHDGAWLVEARVDARERRLTVLGQELLAAPDALGDAVAWASLGDDGALVGTWVAPGARPAWRQLAPALLGQLEVVVPAEGPASAWTAEQRGPFGRGAVRYTGASHHLVRVRAPYARLDALPGGADAGISGAPRGEGRVRLADGHLAELDEHEELVLRSDAGEVRFEGRAALRLRLVGRTSFVPDGRALAGLASLERLDDRAIPGHADAERQALLARIDGLSAGELVAGLLAGSELPDEDRWTWRAAGLLRLDPTLCTRVGELFAAGRLGRAGQALALDLLAGAGTPAAQAAMLVALASPPARAHAADHRALVQRLSFLAEPTAETIAFARALRHEALAAGDAHGARAAAYVMGNLAGSAAAAGDEAAARGLRGELIDALTGADEPAERAALLVAYGASGAADVPEVVARHVADADTGVRRAAVAALAEAPGARAEALLGGLAADGDSVVQETALAALGGRAVDGATIDAVARVADGGRLPAINDLALAGFAAAQHRRGVDVRALHPALARAAARSPDPAVKALVRQATT